MHGAYTWAPSTVPGGTMFLSVDVDGALMVTASRSNHTSKTALVGLGSVPMAGGPRPAEVSALVVLAGDQKLAPLASKQEYSFLVDDASGKTVRIDRLAELPVSNASLETVFQ